MAKIDITKIEGYDKMTPEEKLAALEAFEYEDNFSELEKYKNAASKANSEAAEWRKKHNSMHRTSSTAIFSTSKLTESRRSVSISPAAVF